MTGASERLGVLDIGTQSVLLLVVEPGRAAEGPRAVYEAIRRPRLGEGSGPGRPLDVRAVERTVAAVRELVAEASEVGAARVVAVATAAVRDASDDGALRARVAEILGSEPVVLDERAEAEASARGALSGLRGVRSEGPVTVLDVGGGSTEVARVERGRLAEFFSVPVGAVRLTERLVRHDPLTESERVALREAAREALTGAPLEDAQVVAVGGSATSLAAMTMGLETYDGTRVHGFVLERGALETYYEQLASMSVGRRAALVGLHPSRADVVVAGTALLLAGLEASGADRLVVSDRGVRWGVAMAWLHGAQRSYPDGGGRSA